MEEIISVPLVTSISLYSKIQQDVEKSKKKITSLQTDMIGRKYGEPRYARLKMKTNSYSNSLKKKNKKSYKCLLTLSLVLMTGSKNLRHLAH